MAEYNLLLILDTNFNNSIFHFSLVQRVDPKKRRQINSHARPQFPRENLRRLHPRTHHWCCEARPDGAKSTTGTHLFDALSSKNAYLKNI